MYQLISLQFNLCSLFTHSPSVVLEAMFDVVVMFPSDITNTAGWALQNIYLSAYYNVQCKIVMTGFVCIRRQDDESDTVTAFAA